MENSVMTQNADAIVKGLVDTALTLLEWAEGDTELARGLWRDAFDEAERIDHNRSLGESDELDLAYAEMMRRFDRAVAARQKFHGVGQD